jgi:hypothetical protein
MPTWITISSLHQRPSQPANNVTARNSHAHTYTIRATREVRFRFISGSDSGSFSGSTGGENVVAVRFDSKGFTRGENVVAVRFNSKSFTGGENAVAVYYIDLVFSLLLFLLLFTFTPSLLLFLLLFAFAPSLL